MHMRIWSCPSCMNSDNHHGQNTHKDFPDHFEEWMHDAVVTNRLFKPRVSPTFSLCSERRYSFCSSVTCEKDHHTAVIGATELFRVMPRLHKCPIGSQSPHSRI